MICQDKEIYVSHCYKLRRVCCVDVFWVNWRFELKLRTKIPYVEAAKQTNPVDIFYGIEDT